MAVNSYSPVEFSSDGRPIISSKNALMKCPDGSIHRVPVINCNALKFLQRNYDDDETSSGEEEEAAHASPRASDGANPASPFKFVLPEDREDLFNHLVQEKVICEVHVAIFMYPGY